MVDIITTATSIISVLYYILGLVALVLLIKSMLKYLHS